MKRAASVFITRPDGLILGVSRKDNPNAWGLPGGKVDLGETDEQAAIRECKEETGLDCFKLKKVYEAVCEGEVDYFNICYTAEYNEEDVLVTKEKGRVDWITFQMLLDGPFGIYNYQVLKILGKAPSLYHKLVLSFKDPDGLGQMAYCLKLDKKTIFKYLKYGEFGTIEIIVNNELNIVGGKFLPNERGEGLDVKKETRSDGH